MKSHHISTHELPVDLGDMTHAGLRKIISHLCHGKRMEGDAERASHEASKLADLHEEHKGKSHAPPVEDDDIPFDIADAHSAHKSPDDSDYGDEEEEADEESDGGKKKKKGKMPFQFFKKGKGKNV